MATHTQQPTHLPYPGNTRKPVDIGANGVCMSFDEAGGLINMSAFHSRHGYGGFSVAPPFTDEMRYQQSSVRDYRASLAAQQGFGPKFPQPILSQEVSFLSSAIPRFELTFEGGGSAISTVIIIDGVAIQQWQFKGIKPIWSGNVSVQRAAYTQLTEGGPLQAVTINQTLETTHNGFYIDDLELGLSFAVSGFAMPSKPEKIYANTLLNYKIQAEQAEGLTLMYALGESRNDAAQKMTQASAQLNNDGFAVLLDQQTKQWQQYFANTPTDPILRRGLLYARMMEVPVTSNPDASCLMTDHMLLPLSWNRDAYFTARALLDWGEPHWDLVKRHLIWMFEVADRGEKNEWGRCYLLNGVEKDGAYQLDQQFFPLLELAEYCLITGDNALLDRLSMHVQPIIESVLKRKHPTAYLFPTDETPGDDPLDYAYHFSSHILIWHTLMQLHKVLPDNKLPQNSPYQTLAEQVKEDAQRYFIAAFNDSANNAASTHNGSNIYAYACDTEGHFLFYHDANDVPLALAPEWGFCSADDPVWQATIHFAYSSDNPQGYFGAMRLGSVHTPAPWPLGDVQLMYIAQALDNADMAATAKQNVTKAAQWDGSLSEAYHASNYQVASRHWFAWPSAFYAMNQLKQQPEST